MSNSKRAKERRQKRAKLNKTGRKQLAGDSAGRLYAAFREQKRQEDKKVLQERFPEIFR